MAVEELLFEQRPTQAVERAEPQTAGPAAHRQRDMRPKDDLTSTSDALCKKQTMTPPVLAAFSKA